jgi:hypothetical protein
MASIHKLTIGKYTITITVLGFGMRYLLIQQPIFQSQVVSLGKTEAKSLLKQYKDLEQRRASMQKFYSW